MIFLKFEIQISVPHSLDGSNKKKTFQSVISQVFDCEPYPDNNNQLIIEAYYNGWLVSIVSIVSMVGKSSKR
jgi:hypothetical protein